MMGICFYAVILSFNVHSDKTFDEYSPSYRAKWIKNNYAQRYAECEKLLRLANTANKKFDLEVTPCDKLWVIATASVESGLTNSVVSPKGAKSSMQTYRKYAPQSCKSNKCDLRLAGIYHSVRYKHKHTLCDAATKYNAGPGAKCKQSLSGYAPNVMSVYYELQELTGTQCILEDEKGC